MLFALIVAGPENADKEEAFKWAAESYNMLLEYAKPSNISIVIENHGGVSNDPDWMVAFLNKMDNLSLAAFPDWRSPSQEFDNYTYLQKTAPYAKGMSYRNQPTEELTAKMIKLSHDSGYRGWYGIESKGRDEVKKGIELLKKISSCQSLIELQKVQLSRGLIGMLTSSVSMRRNILR